MEINYEILGYKYVLLDSMHRKEGDEVEFAVPYSRFKAILNQYMNMRTIPGFMNINFERLATYKFRVNGVLYKFVKGNKEEEELRGKCSVCNSKHTGVIKGNVFTCHYCLIVHSDVYMLNIKELNR